MSAASASRSAVRAVVNGGKYWPHTSPVLTVSIFNKLSLIL